jgi:hypothetical protein
MPSLCLRLYLAQTENPHAFIFAKSTCVREFGRMVIRAGGSVIPPGIAVSLFAFVSGANREALFLLSFCKADMRS